MNKNGYLKTLTELKSVLTSSDCHAAIQLLETELKALAKEVKASTPNSSNNSAFVLPKEVVGRATALALFTDGACRGNPGPGSYGFMVQDYTGDVIAEGKEAYEYTTNNKMELSAIIKGLEYLFGENIVTPMHQVYVYTDSKYVVDGMKSWVAGWKKRGWKKADKKTPENVDLWKSLDSLSAQGHIEFHWVKGHAGHPQNEHVDQLANIALDESGY